MGGAGQQVTFGEEGLGTMETLTCYQDWGKFLMMIIKMSKVLYNSWEPDTV